MRARRWSLLASLCESVLRERDALRVGAVGPPAATARASGRRWWWDWGARGCGGGPWLAWAAGCRRRSCPERAPAPRAALTGARAPGVVTGWTVCWMRSLLPIAEDASARLAGLNRTGLGSGPRAVVAPSEEREGGVAARTCACVERMVAAQTVCLGLYGCVSHGRASRRVVRQAGLVFRPQIGLWCAVPCMRAAPQSPSICRVRAAPRSLSLCPLRTRIVEHDFCVHRVDRPSGTWSGSKRQRSASAAVPLPALSGSSVGLEQSRSSDPDGAASLDPGPRTS